MKSSLTISSSKICVHDEETNKALKWPLLFYFFLTFVWISVCIYVCGDGGKREGEGGQYLASSLVILHCGFEKRASYLHSCSLRWVGSPARLWDSYVSIYPALGLQAPSTSPSFLLQVPGSNSGHRSCVSWLFKPGVSELSFKYQQAQGSPTTV